MRAPSVLEWDVDTAIVDVDIHDQTLSECVGCTGERQNAVRFREPGQIERLR